MCQIPARLGEALPLRRGAPRVYDVWSWELRVRRGWGVVGVAPGGVPCETGPGVCVAGDGSILTLLAGGSLPFCLWLLLSGCRLDHVVRVCVTLVLALKPQWAALIGADCFSTIHILRIAGFLQRSSSGDTLRMVGHVARYDTCGRKRG